MANRRWDQFRLSLEKQVVELFLKVDFGAAGAPTKDPTQDFGVASVTRTGAGVYDVVLEDQYFAFLDFNGSHSSAASEDLDWQVSAVNLVTKTITLKSRAAAVDTDPSNGSSAYLRFTLRNTAVSR